MASASQNATNVAILENAEPVTPSSRPWENFKRTTEFWRRAGNVYTAYKVTQVQLPETLY